MLIKTKQRCYICNSNPVGTSWSSVDGAGLVMGPFTLCDWKV